MRYSNRLPVPFPYILFSGAIISLLFVLKEYTSYTLRAASQKFPWFYIISSTSLNYLLWIALTPLLYKIAQKLSFSKKIPWKVLASHLLLSTLIAFIVRLLNFFGMHGILWWKDGYWYPLWNEHNLHSIMVGLFNSILEYWIIIGIFLAIDYYKKFQSKQLEVAMIEKELASSQLDALRMQLHPHFLFNALHTASCLMEENSQGAQKVLAKLAYLLRAMLNQKQLHLISLAEEIKYVQSYLDIEQIRYQDRLRIMYDLTPGSLPHLVPTLILQPLVENAVKHGFAQHMGAGLIKVSSSIGGDKLCLTVEDNGKGVQDPAKVWHSPGIGIANLKTRLSHLYPNDHLFEVHSSEGQGFKATIVLPLTSGK